MLTSTRNRIKQHVWALSAAALALFEIARFVRRFFMRLDKDLGSEAFWIAQSIASGNGFSFSDHRWLFSAAGDGNYYPTAWADPLFTYLLGGMIAVSEEHYVFLVGAFALVCLVVLFAFSYRLGSKLASPAGGFICVATLVSVSAFRHTHIMTNTALAACLILASALALLRFLESPSLRRSVILGLLLGTTTLGCPSAMLFIPVTAVALLYLTAARGQVSVLQAVTTALIAVALISPWTIRNYVVFDEFVPVRSGAGSLAFIGTVAAGGTIQPDTLSSEVKPSWRVSRPRDVVHRWAYQPDRRALEDFQMAYADEVGGAEYAVMNEAQRDKWLMQEAKTYARANLRQSMWFSLWKLERFVEVLGMPGTIVFVLAFIGGLLTIVQKNAATMILAGWVATFVAPFAIIICYFPRYRFPIEPILAVLCALSISYVATTVRERIVQRRVLDETRLSAPTQRGEAT